MKICDCWWGYVLPIPSPVNLYKCEDCGKVYDQENYDKLEDEDE